MWKYGLVLLLAGTAYGQVLTTIPKDGQCLAFDSKTGSYGWTNCGAIICESDSCTTNVPIPTLKTRPNVIPLNQIEQEAIKDGNDAVKDAEDYLAWVHQEQQQIMNLIYEAEGIDKSTTSQWQVMDGEYLVRTGGNGSYGSYYWPAPNMFGTSPADGCCYLDNNNVTR